MANAAYVICGECGTETPANGKFCGSCGAAVGNEDEGMNEQETSPAENAPNFIEDSPLAKGLPEWNIEPPVIAVRRKSKAS